MPRDLDTLPVHAVQTAPVGLVLTNLAGVITEVNPYMTAMLGVGSAEDLIHRRIEDILAPAAKIYFATQLRQLIHLNGGFAEVALKVEWAASVSKDVFVSAARHPSGVTYAVYPATARRSREREFAALRAVAETKNKLLTQIETIASIGAWAIDLTTMITTWSDAVYKIYEMPVGDPVDVDIALSCYPEKPAVKPWRVLSGH